MPGVAAGIPLIQRRLDAVQNFREGVNLMKHLLRGTAVAAVLVIAAPVWAQTPPAPSQPAPYAQPAPSQPAPYKERHAYRKHHKRYVGHMRGYHARGSTAPNDNVADQLNAQQLGRAGGGMGGAPGGMGGAPGPAYGGPRTAPYGQPNQIYGIPGAGQPSPSPPPQ
jgi:hypothetical protein